MQAATAGRFDKASRHYSPLWRSGVVTCSTTCAVLDFVSVFATAMADEKVATHIALAESEIACGRAKRITGELEGLVADHPLREPAWEQLMIAHYVSARQSDALGLRISG